MKFGQQLKENLYPEWRFYYLDYDSLKKYIKERVEHGFTEKDESTFIEMLEKELQKVYSFHEVKVGETRRHVEYCQRKLKKLQDDPAATDEDYAEIEDEINDIIQQFNQLAHFS
ncbi:Phosphate metabolism transcription protein, partial [Tieghemiomyces parasiticus]